MKYTLVIPVALERNAEIIESIRNLDYDKKSFHVVVVRGKNPSENRNKGVEKAKGEIIAFLDDDAIVSRDLLKKADEFFNSYDIDIVGGPQLTPEEDKGIAKISGYALSSKFGAWKVANRYSGKKLILYADETMLTSANLFCKKRVFDKIKFNPDLFPGEDPDFINKARKSGFKVVYNPEMIIYHKRRDNISKLAKQIYNYGKTRPKKESFFETLKMPFFIIPSLFLIYLIFLFIYISSNVTITGSAVGANRNLSFILLLPFFIYLILNLSFSLINALANRDFLALIILPYIYLVIHLSYGFGFLISTLGNIFNKRQKNLNTS